jgi:hypothetical protein
MLATKHARLLLYLVLRCTRNYSSVKRNVNENVEVLVCVGHTQQATQLGGHETGWLSSIIITIDYRFYGQLVPTPGSKAATFILKDYESVQQFTH